MKDPHICEITVSDKNFMTKNLSIMNVHITEVLYTKAN